MFCWKCTTRKIHWKPCTSGIFHILTTEDIDDFTDIVFDHETVIKFFAIWSKHLMIFLESLRQSSVIFANLRKFAEIVWKRSCRILDNLRKFSESGLIYNQKKQCIVALLLFNFTSHDFTPLTCEILELIFHIYACPCIVFCVLDESHRGNIRIYLQITLWQEKQIMMCLTTLNYF